MTKPTRRLAHVQIILCGIAIVLSLCGSFLPTAVAFQPSKLLAGRAASRSASMRLRDNKKPEYSRELLLREEAESPFRKVRFFFYFSLGGGALTSLAVSAARVAAALNGINADLLPESATNVAVDAAGLVVLAILYQNDLKAQESRLKRASKGAELAKLTVRASKNIMTGDLPDGNKRETFTTSLASLRGGRGIDKRVVITAAGPEKLAKVMEQAKQLQDDLLFSDLLIIPYMLGPSGSLTVDEDNLPDCVALPTPGNTSWKSVMDEEVAEATSQGIDAQTDGVCIILKKNGRIGQRTKGINLSNMVAEVSGRAAMGMDVTNI